MTPEYARNWYPIERIQEITGACERTIRRKLSRVPDQNVRLDRSSGGRPRYLYHAESLPELAVYHRSQVSPPCVMPSLSAVGPAKDRKSVV